MPSPVSEANGASAKREILDLLGQVRPQAYVAAASAIER
jgi:hypothetical protein